MYDYTKHSDVVVIKLVGELNLENANNFKEWIMYEFINQGDNKILLDMSKLKSLDSFALGKIITIYKNLLITGGSFGILSPNASIKRLFEVSGLEKIIKVYETLSKAMEKMKR